MLNCPLCKNSNLSILSEKLRRGEGKVLYCSSCDLGFLEKFIENTQEYYNKEYRKEYSHKADTAGTNAEELFNIYSKFQNQRIEIIEPYLNKDKDILEIGSSAGMFIYHIIDKCKSVSAIEFDMNCVNYVKSKFDIDIDTEPLADSFLKKKQYDIICSFQVIEHTDDPLEFINQIYSALKPDGFAFIEMPNLHDPLLSLWKVEYYKQFYYHSAHNFYFSEKALKTLISKTPFVIHDIIYTQDYNLLNHINWVLNNTPQPTCEIGLNKPELISVNPDFTKWFNDELNNFNEKYMKKLAELKSTSNIMLILKK